MFPTAQLQPMAALTAKISYCYCKMQPCPTVAAADLHPSHCLLDSDSVEVTDYILWSRPALSAFVPGDEVCAGFQVKSTGA